MQIVIDIPEEEYQNYLKMRPSYPEGVFCYIKAIQNGKPLPKGHGRLIDADAVDTRYSDPEVIETLNQAPTIIEADKEV
jgi:hypothetical protein